MEDAVEAQDRQWEVEDRVLLEVLDRVMGVLEQERRPHVVMGGIASAVHGRPRWTHDIDLFVRPEDARRLLLAFEKEGFETEETDHYWLFKAWLHEVLVDLVFRSIGDIHLDEEMVHRAVETTFRGHPVRVIAPEDLLVIKALAHAEHSPRHWHDGVALVASCDLDWEYLLRRARHGPRRVLSLLLYAESNDLAVPDHVLRDLFSVVVAAR